MTISRRDFLKLSTLIASTGALAACQPAYQWLGGEVELEHGAALPYLSARTSTALGRLTFGARRSESIWVSEHGLAAWIESQLEPELLDDSALAWRLRPHDILELRAADLRSIGDRLFDGIDPDAVIGPLASATLLRQVYSQRQLYEKMVAFWSDHFNVSVSKGDCWYLKPVDDREVIRRHALGNFGELLHASAKSPAMLVYLDNQVNQARAPNENYARELLELHTLGVDGGYTQRDVMELARCLTGWGMKDFLWHGEFAFNSDVHDADSKRVLAVDISPGGLAEAEGVLDRLARHPATAQHLALKLARYFISQDPPAELVGRTAQAFLASGGDIQTTLYSLLLDGLVTRKAMLPARYKRPQSFILSAMRAADAETDGGPALRAMFARMGQPLFEWPTPDGPPFDGPEWQGNLLPRWQFALALAQNRLSGTEVRLPRLFAEQEPSSLEECLARLSARLLSRAMPAGPRRELARTLIAAGAPDSMESAPIILSGILASPAFQWI